jgi:hypothetical protein
MDLFGETQLGIGIDQLGSDGFVGDLNKALAAGSDISNPGASPGEGFPLRVESLDSTLYNTTFSMEDIKFWKAISKDKAYNTVEEFNQLSGYGSGNAFWMAEGELPSEDDSTYIRNYTKIKFMGTVRRVTHPMTVIKAAHGDAVARETVNGTMHLLRQVERALFDGNSNLMDLQFDGLEHLHVSAWGGTLEDDGQLSGYGHENVIDLRGQPMTEDVITDLAEILVKEPNYGAPNKLWASTGPIKDLSKIMYPKERVSVPAPSAGGVAGVVVKAVATPFGNIDLEPNIFVPNSAKPVTDGVGRSAQRPAAPTVGSPTSPAYAGSYQTYFGATDAGAYYYKIVAVNRDGKSTPVTSAQVTVSSGDLVQFTVTEGSGPETAYYEVFRSDKNGAATTCRSIFRVKRSAATQTIKDINRFLPGCDKAYMLTHTAEVLKWLQLTPFTKMPLATIDSSIRWMQLLYGALQVMAPLKNGMIINIGRLETGAYA